VTGELPRADKSRLRSSADVGDAIAKAVLASCAKDARRNLESKLVKYPGP
jgi:hypothetical protein